MFNNSSDYHANEVEGKARFRVKNVMQQIQGDDKDIIFRKTKIQGMLSASKMFNNSKYFFISSSLYSMHHCLTF